jgi:hypothetical protein
MHLNLRYDNCGFICLFRRIDTGYVSYRTRNTAYVKLCTYIIDVYENSTHSIYYKINKKPFKSCMTYLLLEKWFAACNVSTTLISTAGQRKAHEYSSKATVFYVQIDRHTTIKLYTTVFERGLEVF